MDHSTTEVNPPLAPRWGRRSLVVLAIAGCLGLAACGSTDTDKLKSQASELSEKAKTTAEDIKNGDVKPEDGVKDLTSDAKNLANDAMDSAKEQVPDEYKDDIQKAQDQLNESP